MVLKYKHFIQFPISLIAAFLLNISFPFASYGFENSNNPPEWRLELNRAKVATFYSAAYGNGYDELKLAQQYVKSARVKLLKAIENDSSLVRYMPLVDGLWEELSGSEAIAVDNLNYRYPTSSLLAGHRNDFEVRDSAEELLIEDLLEKILDQNDPLTRGRIAESIDFVVLQVAPYDQNLVLVGSDYFSANSGHYVIRLHELTEILGPTGFIRYKENNLIDEDWERIFKAYKIDKVLNIQVSDRGSIIPGLFYKGVALYTVKQGEEPVYVSYFEKFKVDKIDSWNQAVITMLLNILLLFLGLFLIFTVKVQKAPNKGRFLGYDILFDVNTKFIWEICVIASTSIITIAIFHVIGEQFAPGINSYYKESLVYVWVAYQVFIPFIGAVILSYLVLSKLPGIIVNNEESYIAILFGALMAQVVILSYYEYHIALISNPIFYYFKWIAFFGLLFSGVVSGKLLNRIYKKEPVSRIGKSLLILMLISPCIGFWLEFGGSVYNSNLIYALSGVFGIVILLNPKWLRIPNSNKPTLQSLENKKGLEEPITWYTSGTNANLLSDQLIQFIQSDSFDDRTFILNGISGVGKTRLLSEVIKKIRRDNLKVRWFQGTCNTSEETESTNFDAFEDAFSINGERVSTDLEAADRTLPHGFFSDRTHLASSLGKAIQQITSSTMINVSDMLHIENAQVKSVDEIARELLNFLLEKYVKASRSKVILVLDDFQWASSNTKSLLEKFRTLVNEKPNYAPYFKFILVISTSEHIQVAGALSASYKVKSSTLILDDGVAFANSIIQDECFQIPGYETCFRFDALLKGHILKMLNSNQVVFTPGDFFGYLATLEREDFISLDNDVVRLVKEPSEDEIQLLHVRRASFEKAFNQLEDSDKALLESASIVGYKFDAEILSKIWKLDLIRVLERLEKLEDEFVKDQSHEDNIYAFSDKTLYQVIRNSAAKNKKKNDSRQLIVEYQKRIISTVLEDNDNHYLEGLDLDILLSVSKRCFNYNHVSYIRANTPIIVLTACKKLAIKGLEGPCLKFLKNLYEQGLSLNSQELILLLDVLQALTYSDRSITRFEFINKEIKNQSDDLKSKGSFLEVVYRLSEKYSVSMPGDAVETALDKIAVILMGGVMSFVRPLIRFGRISDISDLKKVENTSNIQYLDDIQNAQIIIKWFECISILINEDKILNEPSLQRIHFYSLICQNESPEKFYQLFERALNTSNFDLAGEISRDLCMSGSAENKHKFLFSALRLISGAVFDVSEFDSITLNQNKVRDSISKFIERKDLSPKITSDFNFLLSRLREYFYLKEEYDFVLELTEMALEISISMNDSIGQKLAWSYKGAANFKLKEFKNSLEAYWEYFEFMLRTTRKAEEFVYPMEGIIRASLQLNSFDVYIKAYQDLYESLIILGKPLIDEPIKFSLIDNSQSISELIDRIPKVPKIDYDNEVTLQAKLVLQLIVSVALADGKIESKETYNLIEVTRALSHALNINFNAMLSELESCKKRILNNVADSKHEIAFRNDCESLKMLKCSLSPEVVLDLCSVIAGADNNWAEFEIVLVNIVKEVFDF